MTSQDRLAVEDTAALIDANAPDPSDGGTVADRTSPSAQVITRDSPAPIEGDRPPKLPVPIYPTVLGLAFLVELFIASGVSPFSALRVFLVAMVMLLVMTAIGQLILRDRDRGALAAALGILALMAGVDLRLLVVVLVAIGALIVERYVLPRRLQTIRWPRITRIMSRLTAVLVLAVGIHALQEGTFGSVARAIMTETVLRPAVSGPASATDPDIYTVLLDGHARADVLSERFGVDGAAFTTELETRGFQVATNSRSNYPRTSETLSSMLNLQHLRDMPRMRGLLDGSANTVQGNILRDVINDSLVFRELRSRGYTVESISSGFEEVSIREADRFVDTGELNEFEVGMLRRTIVGDILQVIAPDVVSGQYRSRIEGVFEALGTVAPPADRPMFLFAHVPSPHPPWVSHADGSPRTVTDLEAIYADTPASTGMSLPELRRAYGEQVIDVDRRLLASLDKLDSQIASRDRPAVVVVWSDHGSWVDADGGDIDLRFKNLLAVRSTGPTLELEDDLTTVNLFGWLFSDLFGIAWERQPDITDLYDLTSIAEPGAAQ